MLKLEGVCKTFRVEKGLGAEIISRIKGFAFGKNSKKGQKDVNREIESGGVQAVRGVDLELKSGEILGLVGESGSGKSTLARVMAGLYQPNRGRVMWEGHDLSRMNSNLYKQFRSKVQIMFQDPVSSLNPRFSAGAVLEEGLIIHRLGTASWRRQRVDSLLAEVGLPPDIRGRYGHEFSGGQRQRLCLARALSLDPEILIADEPVSALDVSIQAQIINLLLDFRKSRNLTLVLVSHDLPLVRQVADRLVVMYGGLVMEMVDRVRLGRLRHHPYLQSLWSSAGGGGEVVLLEGEPPDPQNPPPGCPFQPRCPEAIELCLTRPPLTVYDPQYACACHLRAGTCLHPLKGKPPTTSR